MRNFRSIKAINNKDLMEAQVKFKFRIPRP